MDRPKPGAVLFAKKRPLLATSYEAVGGLSVVHAEPEVIGLGSTRRQLVLHGIPPRVARTIEITSRPGLRAGTPVKLVFAVRSVADARASALALDSGVNSMTKASEARGFRACDAHDPEGNVIQLREHVGRRSHPEVGSNAAARPLSRCRCR